MTTRAHPWHQRQATAEHELRFRKLLDLHALTLLWIERFQPDRGIELIREELEGGDSGPKLSELLSRVAQGPAPLESFLDEFYPEEFLGRLEHAVWRLQGAVLKRIRKKEGAAADAELAALADRAGRECARSRWPVLPETARGSLRGLYFASLGTPLGACLPIRLSDEEVIVELLECPHERARAMGPEIAAELTSSLAEALCALHFAWQTGYLAELRGQATPRIACEHETGARCKQRWYLPRT